jgi:hypothetical protein
VQDRTGLGCCLASREKPLFAAFSIHLGWAKAHKLKPLEGALLGQGAAVFELEASRSWPHSALTLFIKKRVVKVSDLEELILAFKFAVSIR